MQGKRLPKVSNPHPIPSLTWPDSTLSGIPTSTYPRGVVGGAWHTFDRCIIHNPYGETQWGTVNTEITVRNLPFCLIPQLILLQSCTHYSHTVVAYPGCWHGAAHVCYNKWECDGKGSLEQRDTSRRPLPTDMTCQMHACHARGAWCSVNVPGNCISIWAWTRLMVSFRFSAALYLQVMPWSFWTLYQLLRSKPVVIQYVRKKREAISIPCTISSSYTPKFLLLLLKGRALVWRKHIHFHGVPL